MKFNFKASVNNVIIMRNIILRDLVQTLKCQEFHNYDVQKAD